MKFNVNISKKEFEQICLATYKVVQCIKKNPDENWIPKTYDELRFCDRSTRRRLYNKISTLTQMYLNKINKNKIHEKTSFRKSNLIVTIAATQLNYWYKENSKLSISRVKYDVAHPVNLGVACCVVKYLEDAPAVYIDDRDRNNDNNNTEPASL